jgi:polysaccharide export outer membrane protein
MAKYLYILAFLSVMFSSCTVKKQLVYLQKIDTDSTANFFPKTQPEYRIQKQDILYIRVYTLNQEVSDMINQNVSIYQQNMFQNETSLFINGYIVNDSGYVEIPIIGKVNVFNKTLDEATEDVRIASKVYLKDATIVVKLISFKFSVLGEVKRPDTYRNFNNQLTVLEAISIAGDITDYGDRKNVLVLRPTREGTQTFRLDLTNKNILTSDGFFLLPNDIVYVEPIRTKLFRLNTPTYTLVLSSITTLILILNYIDNY